MLNYSRLAAIHPISYDSVSSGVHCPLGVICISEKDRPFVKNGVQYLVYILHPTCLRVLAYIHHFSHRGCQVANPTINIMACTKKI